MKHSKKGNVSDINVAGALLQGMKRSRSATPAVKDSQAPRGRKTHVARGDVSGQRRLRNPFIGPTCEMSVRAPDS